MLDLQRLRVFRAVVASGSIQAAASHLRYTPSAVSQQVSALQRETGLSLLVRVGRGVEPTPAGLELAGRIDGLLGEMGAVEELVTDLREGRRGLVRLGFMASSASAWLPTLMGVLEAEFPDVRIELEIRDHIAEDAPCDLQVAVGAADHAPPAGYRSELLLRDPYVAVVPEDHPFASLESVEFGQLSAERWIDNDVAGGWCREVVVDAALAAGFAAPFRLAVHDYVTAMAFVAQGLGVSIVPALGARQHPRGTAVVPLVDPTPERCIHAIVSTTIQETPLARRALEVLRTVADAGAVEWARPAQPSVG